MCISLFFLFHPLLRFGYSVNVLEAAVASVGPFTVTVFLLGLFGLFYFSPTHCLGSLMLVSTFLFMVFSPLSIKHTTV